MKGIKELRTQEEGRKTEGGGGWVAMFPAYNGGLPQLLLFPQQAILEQSINAAVKVFASTEGR